jgi:hypothetical protein
MTPTYLVHSISVGHQPDGTPIGYVTLACTVEEAQAAGAMLYCDVTLEPVDPGASSVAAAMPGTAVYDLDDPIDYGRFLDRLQTRAQNALDPAWEIAQKRWLGVLAREVPRTLRDLIGVGRRRLALVKHVGPKTVREIREALVEAGLPDLAE